MRRSARLAALALLLAGWGGCAHAPAAARRLPDVSWPAEPGAARVRLAGVFPDPDAAARPARSRWRALLDAIAGRDARRDAEPWLVRPFGVAALPDGDWLVLDPDAASVLRVSARGEPSRVECRKRTWQAPMAAAVAPDGALWIADGGAAEVVRVAPDGSCRATAAGVLERPTGVAISGERIFVVDPPRHQVVVLDAAGAPVARIGARGEGPGELNFPTAVAVDARGDLLVVDALNFRIARFTADGAWMGAFGGGDGAVLGRPKGVAVDAAGLVYVSDAHRDAVVVFSPDGALEAVLGEPGAGPGFLTMPAGVAIQGSRLCVADSQNHRIQVFELLGGRT